MKKANQGAQKFTRLIENYELDEAAIYLAERVFKQKDQVKSEQWRDELRRALSRIKMTLDSNDEAMASLSLPWYGGRKDEFGRIEVDNGRLKVAPSQRWRGRPNFADAAYWNVWWDDYLSFNGYFCKKFEDVNCEFDDVWPVMETFVLAREVVAREKQAKVVARREDEAGKATQLAASISKAAAIAASAGLSLPTSPSAAAASAFSPTAPRGRQTRGGKEQGANKSGRGDAKETASGGAGGDGTAVATTIAKQRGGKSDSGGDDSSDGDGSSRSSNGDDDEDDEDDEDFSLLKSQRDAADPKTPEGSRLIAEAAEGLAYRAREKLSLLQRVPNRSALVIGCGLSTTPLQLYEKGFTRVLCLDVSAKVVQNLSERYKDFPGIEVLECDARNLDRFASGTFDLVVDKGLVDVLFTGWVGFKDVDLVCEAVCRVLSPGACFVSVCSAPPALRSAHFYESSTPETADQYHPWTVTVAKGPPDKGDSGGLWVYVMTRLFPGETTERGDPVHGHDTDELREAATGAKDAVAKEAKARFDAEEKDASEAFLGAKALRAQKERKVALLAARSQADAATQAVGQSVDPAAVKVLEATAKGLLEEWEALEEAEVKERRKEKRALEKKKKREEKEKSTKRSAGGEGEDEAGKAEEAEISAAKAKAKNNLGSPPKVKEGKQLSQKAYHPPPAASGKKAGWMDLQVVRDHWVVEVASAAPRMQQRPPTPTAEEYLLDSKTPAEAAAAQLAKRVAIETGQLLNTNQGEGTKDGGGGGEEGGGGLKGAQESSAGSSSGSAPAPPLIESEVGWEKKAEALRRAIADNKAIRGGSPAGKGFYSEKFLAQKIADEKAKRRQFSLEPVKEMARDTVRRLVVASGGDAGDDTGQQQTSSKEGLQDVNAMIAELVKGQKELTRLRLERPPQPLEPRGDAKPVTIRAYDRAKQEMEDAELRAHRAKMGLDENDLTKPPEKWTPAMLSFVEFTPGYGPRPPAEVVWEALTDMNELTSISKRVVRDPACHRQLQQWCDGKSKVYKFFLTRALEATEDKAPVQLLRQALNIALGEYRPVDDDLVAAAAGQGKGGDAKDPTAAKRRQRANKAAQGTAASTSAEGGGGGEAGKEGGGSGGGKGRRLSSSQERPNGQSKKTSAASEAKANRMKALRLMEEKLRKGKQFDDDDKMFGNDDHD